MNLFIIVFVAGSISAVLGSKHPCDGVECRAGRECIDVGGVGECLCMVSCPDHFRPVCGSDGETYDSHCKLHQHACLTGKHISVNHKGFCKKVFKTQKEKDVSHATLTKIELQNEIGNDLLADFHKVEKEQEQNERKEHKGPAVCFSSQRDALRFLMIKHWEENLKKQPWYTKGMSYRESLWGWFFSCDSNKDNYLNAAELLSCSKKVDFFARPEQNPKLTKSLCIDAILDDGDQNKDWRLSFEEFTRIMSQEYFPKEKKCSLEGESYQDGAQVHVDCNQCTCALGSWVCAASDCIKDKDGKKKHPMEFFGYEDAVKNAISEDDILGIPEDKEIIKNDVIDDEEDDIDLEANNYDDLIYEKTKSKNIKKRKKELEKALQEIKELRKKTEQLNNFWKKQLEDEIEEEHKKEKKFLKERNFKKTKNKYKKYKNKHLKKKHSKHSWNHHKKWQFKDI